MDVPANSELIRVTTATREALLADLGQRMRAKIGFAVATLNLDHVVKLRRDPAFRAAYERQTHVVADGNPIVWLHRLAGHEAELVTGSDLVEPLMALARAQNVRVAFFGSTRDTLDAAAQRLVELYPGLEIAASIAPEFDFDPYGSAADASIRQIAASGAHLCLVALGAPKQEVFAARAAQALPECGFVSIGAGLDFIAGTQLRAPKFVRRVALEWLWRLATDRRRLARRYFECALALPGLAASALRERFDAPALVRKAPPANPSQNEPVEE